MKFSIPVGEQFFDMAYMSDFRDRNGVDPAWLDRTVLIIKAYRGSFETVSEPSNDKTINIRIDFEELEARARCALALDETPQERNFVFDLRAVSAIEIIQKYRDLLPLLSQEEDQVSLIENGEQKQIKLGKYVITTHLIRAGYQESPDDPRPFKTWMLSPNNPDNAQVFDEIFSAIERETAILITPALAKPGVDI